MLSKDRVHTLFTMPPHRYKKSDVEDLEEIFQNCTNFVNRCTIKNALAKIAIKEFPVTHKEVLKIKKYLQNYNRDTVCSRCQLQNS